MNPTAHNTLRSTHRHHLLAASLLLLSATAGSASAASAGAHATAAAPSAAVAVKAESVTASGSKAGRTAEARNAIEARYRAERAACERGDTGQAKADCLKEAVNARAQALQQGLDSGATEADLLANRLKRCEVQAPADRPACEMLARGEGHSSGSVAEGGVIREVVTRSVGSPAMPANKPQR